MAETVSRGRRFREEDVSWLFKAGFVFEGAGGFVGWLVRGASEGSGRELSEVVDMFS